MTHSQGIGNKYVMCECWMLGGAEGGHWCVNRIQIARTMIAINNYNEPRPDEGQQCLTRLSAFFLLLGGSFRCLDDSACHQYKVIE